MANHKHLRLLTKGRSSWNRWRQQHPELRPDLSGAHLSGADLSGADLSGAHLSGAHLSGADLTKADLSKADLSKAHLSKAHLSGADLSEAHLSGADLSGADLSGADLNEGDVSEAILYRANLSHAHLSRTKLNWAILVDADFNYSNLDNADLSHASFKNNDIFIEYLRKNKGFPSTYKLANLDFSKISINGTDLSETDLSGVDLSEVDLSKTKLQKASLQVANLRKANLSRAYLHGIDLSFADLSGANLSFANLSFADLSGANLRDADLTGANLSRAIIVQTNLTQSNLDNCLVYGAAIWDVKLDQARQSNLVITPKNQSSIAVDNLKVAQFIYLILNNQEIREIFDTVVKKAVLIFGRFAGERKVILEAIRDALRAQNYLPILFDFEQPAGRDITETITTLARLSRFIIADLSDPPTIAQELASILPGLPSVPVQPIIHGSQASSAVFEYINRFPLVLPLYSYQDQAALLHSLNEHVLDLAEQIAQESEQR